MQTITIMKTFAFLIAAIIFGVSCDDDDRLKAWKEMHKELAECAKEVGVDKELVKKAFHDGEFADDKNLKCYYKCVLEKHGQIDANGKIDLSGMVNSLPPGIDKQKIDDAVEKCGKTEGDDACQVAMDVVKCTREIFHKN